MDSLNRLIAGHRFKPRYIVPVAAAILLTFGRTGMLPFLGRLTILDHLMNIFVVVVAPVLSLIALFRRQAGYNIPLLVPILLLGAWLSIVILLMSPRELWPSRTALITIALALILCSQIAVEELHHVRHGVLLLTALFGVCTLLFGRATIGYILSGSLLGMRLGAEHSASAIIAFPRIMYVLVLTCIATIVIDKKGWIRIVAALSIPIPLLIAFSAGARGPLLALVVALITFVLGLKKKIEVIVSFIVLGLFTVLGYNFFLNYFPLRDSRLLRDNRSGVWEWALSYDISIVGQGITPRYPHNIFLEFLVNYGLVGLTLFLVVLTITVVTVSKAYARTGNKEVLWVVCLLVLQMTAQQFSLSIYFAGPLWAAMVMPLGLIQNRTIVGVVHRSKSVGAPAP
ncbi:MAG: hypothetical protein WAU91_16845 [Desulfatitalea sp.]